MNDCIILPRSILETDAKTIWVYANLFEIADENGLAEVRVSKWCSEIGLTHQQVRAALNCLASTNKIAIKTTNKKTYITICNYGEYGSLHRNKKQSTQQTKQQVNTKNISSDTLMFASQKYSFVDPMFEDAFTSWIEYKKTEFNDRYKTEQTLKAAYKKLVELSDYNPCTAMKIVEQSMAYKWKGLFPLKDDGTEKSKTNSACRAASRDRMLRLATEVISHSTAIANLYNGCIPDSDIGKN